MRLFNRLAAVLLAMAVMAAAVIFIIEVIAQRLHRRFVIVNWHRIDHWATHTTWGATPIRAISALLILLGLIVLATQLKRRRPERLAVTGGNRATDTAVTRQGVAHTVRHAVADIDGIHAVSVLVRRRITVNARTRVAASAQTVAEVARSAVDGLHLQHPPQVSVHVRTEEQ